MACPCSGSTKTAEQMNTMAIIAHLVRILDMGCIDRSSKEVLHSKRFPGASVLGSGGGSFQVPYGVLQCIRKPKSFVACRVADIQGAQGSKRRSHRTQSPIHLSRSAGG